MTRTALVAIGTFLTSALPASAQQDYGPGECMSGDGAACGLGHC